MAGVKITGLNKTYFIKGQVIRALNDFNLEIEDGSFTTIVGKSGSGKTTLLRLLSGLEEKTSGKLEFYFGDGNHTASSERVGIVFQEPRLMPWLTVRENIAFSQYKKRNEKINMEVVDEYLEILGLQGFGDAYPSQISGGMAQRAALGRALFFDPDIILMDEPFGALDYFTRKKLQNEIMELFIAQKKTFILVTHDVEEAVYLSQKIVVLDEGKTVAEFGIDLPYPRQPTDHEFLALREKTYQAITESNHC
ncbi:MAG: ABC transporter ATP-binding protein [Syntrophomonadales bacterium]|jgi:sulfonate transport system ATP-binding protein